MTYEDHWNEMKDWLDKGMEHLENAIKEEESFEFPSGKKEAERLRNKLEGMKISRQHMAETEKIYNL